MEQVASIHRDIEQQAICGPKGERLRIEMFCHGALCMAVSGKCYLSLNNYGLSANRGACVQVCRRGYTVKDKSSDLELDIDNQYIMSPKDLKTIHFLNKMLDAGVRVLKIEGRARGAEYVSTVVRCYKEAVEAWQRGEYTDSAVIEPKITDWNERLSRVFNRGFWDGYYQGQRLGEWTREYGNKATRKKIYAAKCTNFFKNLSVAEFVVEAVEAIEEGQHILITGETTGVYECTATGMRDAAGKPTRRIRQGEFFSLKTDRIIRRGDKLYLWQTDD
jgi:putative protease